MADENRPLVDVYWDVMMEDPIELEPFIQRVAAGEFGAYPKQSVIDFLREVEQDILGSIATKASALALAPSDVEDLSEDTRHMIEGLIRKYAG